MPRKKKYDKRGRPPKHQAIRIVELDEIFKTYIEVADRIGANRGNVWLCLYGDRKTCNGFTFEFVDIDSDKR